MILLPVESIAFLLNSSENGEVSQKFRPDLNDEQAEAHFLQLINESTSALFPIVVEKFHKWALYWM